MGEIDDLISEVKTKVSLRQYHNPYNSHFTNKNNYNFLNHLWWRYIFDHFQKQKTPDVVQPERKKRVSFSSPETEEVALKKINIEDNRIIWKGIMKLKIAIQL